MVRAFEMHTPYSLGPLQALTAVCAHPLCTDETMLPEGLEFASAEEILEQVASVGFNFVRMSVKSS